MCRPKKKKEAISKSLFIILWETLVKSSEIASFYLWWYPDDDILTDHSKKFNRGIFSCVRKMTTS